MMILTISEYISIFKVILISTTTKYIIYSEVYISKEIGCVIDY